MSDRTTRATASPAEVQRLGHLALVTKHLAAPLEATVTVARDTQLAGAVAAATAQLGAVAGLAVTLATARAQAAPRAVRPAEVRPPLCVDEGGGGRRRLAVGSRLKTVAVVARTHARRLVVGGHQTGAHVPEQRCLSPAGA